jgi:hypothetical protein
MKKEEIDAIKKDAADKETSGGLEHAIVRYLGYGHAIHLNRFQNKGIPPFLTNEVAAITAEITSSAFDRAVAMWKQGAGK